MKKLLFLIKIYFLNKVQLIQIKILQKIKQNGEKYE